MNLTADLKIKEICVLGNAVKTLQHFWQLRVRWLNLGVRLTREIQ